MRIGGMGSVFKFHPLNGVLRAQGWGVIRFRPMIVWMLRIGVIERCNNLMDGT